MSEEKALVKQDAELVTVPTKGGNGERLVARGTDGKFASKHKAATKKSIKDVIAFFEGKAIDPETGKLMDKTRHEAILDKLFSAMMSATGEDLVGLSKAYSELQRSAYGTKGKDRIIERADPDGGTEIRVILIPSLPANHPASEQRLKPTPTKPSWIDAEVVETNPPQTTQGNAVKADVH